MKIQQGGGGILQGLANRKKERILQKKENTQKIYQVIRKYTRSNKKYTRLEEVSLKGLATGKKRHQVI